ncbi:MAG: DUF881 domain-containing protein [Armatimonadota bacterium]
MRMQVPLRKPQPWVLPVTLASLALGALIASKLTATDDNAIDVYKMRPEQVAVLYTQAVRENQQQQEQLVKLQNRLDKLVDGATDEVKLREALQKEIDDLRVRSGSTAVEGPGIVVTIDDTNILKSKPADLNTAVMVTHDYDLLLVVNELRAAGAEAIAVNDQRVVGSSAIRCAGPIININNHQVGAPFIIRAVGKPDTLAGAMTLPNGELDQLKLLGIHVQIDKRELIRVPAVSVLPAMQVGKPVPQKDTDTNGK